MHNHDTSNMPRLPDTLVLGIGNTLLSDEGAGVHAMRFLRDHYELPDTRYLDGGTLSFTLMDDIERAHRLIVFDAAELDAEAGTVRVFEGEAFDEMLMTGRRSVHEVGFTDLVNIARLEGCMPRDYALIGIQPEFMGWGEHPGAAVRRAIPLAASCAAGLIFKWLQTTPLAAVNQ